MSVKFFSRLLRRLGWFVGIAALCGLSPRGYAEEWITEEVLKQLTEIRQELTALRLQVNALESAIEAESPVAAANTPPDNTVTATSKISLGDAPRLGNADAKVAILEYSDYQCPYCRRHFKQTLPQLKAKYIDKGLVQYAVGDFPLSFHPQARPAAVATHCAAQQRPASYWQMHQKLFDGPALSAETYLSVAGELKLDTAVFERCLTDPKMDALVDDSIQQAQRLGVNGTPAFFIGVVEQGNIVQPVFLSGAQPFSVFARHIERLLSN